MTIKENLKKYFGYTNFKEGQEKVIQSIEKGYDTVAVMPTGGGKSICYQLPALDMKGITIVISPLISLMHDQVITLKQIGVAAAYINSSLTNAQLDIVFCRASQGYYKIIYIAPERLLTTQFLEFAKNVKIEMVTIDEAHCISQWGQDFRPSYRDIPKFISKLSYRPIISAFTATATKKVREDIIEKLNLFNPNIYINSFDRPNLYFEVRHIKNKKSVLLDFVKENNNLNGIVYCTSRKEVEEICDYLIKNGYNATRYHAGLDNEERKQNQDDFINDAKNIMVATNAFGMGIDKSNVNYVIHYNMPKDLESYYQEAGRAGRDGANAKCILLYAKRDIFTIKWMINHRQDRSVDLTENELKDVKIKEKERLNIMVSYCNSSECLRSYILKYFGENPPEKCDNCSNCNSDFDDTDITDISYKIFNCIMELQRNFGITMICNILRGSKNQKIISFGFNQLHSFNTVTESKDHLYSIIQSLIIKGYLIQEELDYPIIKLSAQGKMALDNKIVIKMKLSKKNYENKNNNNVAQKTQNKKLKHLINEQDKELFDLLRLVRSKLSAENKVPAYIIFDDKTLVNLATEKPKSNKDMLNVSGVGEIKLERYGNEFLTTIRDYLEKNEKINIINSKQTEEIPEIVLCKIEPMVNDTTIVAFVSYLKSQIEVLGYKTRLTAIKVNDFLVEKGYLDVICSKDSKRTSKIPTKSGLENGIYQEEAEGKNNEKYLSIKYTIEMQKYIIDNLNNILTTD